MTWSPKPIVPRFADCKSCRHYSRSWVKRACSGCTFGQNFEEKLEEMNIDLGFSNFKSRSNDD